MSTSSVFQASRSCVRVGHRKLGVGVVPGLSKWGVSVAALFSFARSKGRISCSFLSRWTYSVEGRSGRRSLPP